MWADVHPVGACGVVMAPAGRSALMDHAGADGRAVVPRPVATALRACTLRSMSAELTPEFLRGELRMKLLRMISAPTLGLSLPLTCDQWHHFRLKGSKKLPFRAGVSGRASASRPHGASNQVSTLHQLARFSSPMAWRSLARKPA